VHAPVVRSVRDATGPPRGDVRRDREHGARELAPERTVGMDRLPMARGRGLPRYRDRGRGPQDTAHRDIGDRRLAPACAPPRRDAMSPMSAANPSRYAHPMTISDVGIVMSPK